MRDSLFRSEIWFGTRRSRRIFWVEVETLLGQTNHTKPRAVKPPRHSTTHFPITVLSLPNLAANYWIFRILPHFTRFPPPAVEFSFIQVILLASSITIADSSCQCEDNFPLRTSLGFSRLEYCLPLNMPEPKPRNIFKRCGDRLRLGLSKDRSKTDLFPPTWQYEQIPNRGSRLGNRGSITIRDPY
jgi:hypothetical protein